MSSAKSNNQKSRYGSFIMYPESMPDDFIDILTKTGLQMFISPLHDRDLNADETPKKPHYHVVVLFSGPTTLNTFNRISDSVNGTQSQLVNSVIGLYRYSTHKDNPEKYQYNEKDFIYINGFSPLDIEELSTSDLLMIEKDIINLIAEVDLYEYCDLVDYGIIHLNDSYFNVIASHTYFFKSYLNSRRYKRFSPKGGNADDL